ncbi:MAG: ATP-binding protein [Lachnospiraceae bacterium]|nr:ATP-binding protein [Lachnospiraceae bacterium]
MPLPTWQFEQILRTYDRTRQKNHALHLKRQEEVYQNIPEIKEIDRQITSRSIQTGRQLLFQKDEQALHQLHLDNLELSMQKVELLVSNGYAPDYLSPIYDCPICKDTGYIDGEKCACLKKAIIHQVYHQSNIQEKLKEENFQTFSYEYYANTPMHPNLPSPRQNMISIVEKCMDFIQTFHTNPGQNILFQGDVGVGKTFLTNCIAKELIDETCTVIYLTSFQLVEILENHRFHRNDTPDSLYTMDYILTCDLLIIDDLGTELLNDLVTSQLFLCINERLLGKKSTIISTNLSLSELTDAYSERIVSRITENYLICKIYGDDIRIKKSFTN